MFYSTHLLSYRSKGKLAPCWLAATYSEKSFKKYYNLAAIKKINVVITCEEILRAVQLRSGRTKRFSLYLSSQLMYGVTRIFSYQIIYYQKELFEIWKILDHTTEKRLEENFDAVRALDTLQEMELPLMEQTLDLQMKEDLHILPGEIPDDRLEVIMQDAMCLNFGVLNEELDVMLEYTINDMILKMRSMMEVVDNSRQRSNTEMVADVEISNKTYREMQSPRAFPSPMLVDKSKIIDKSKEKLPSTPQKRQPRQPQVETPTKRRRISLENGELPIADAIIDVAPVPLENVPVAEQLLTRTLSVTDVEMTAPLQHIDKDMNMKIESLHSSLDRYVIKKKNLIIDKQKVKTDAVLKKWRENIKFECMEMKEPNVHVISSVDLLKRPLHSPYAQALFNLFVNHTKRPCKSATEDTAPIFMQSQEEIRELQTMEDHTGPMTSKLETSKPEEISTEQFSTVIPVQAPWVIDEPLHKEMRADVDDANGSLEDIDVLINKMQVLSATKDIISLSSRSTEKSQYAYLTSREVLTLLEVLWCNQPYVKFRDFIPKDTHSKQNAYTKQDAATVFCILLDLHAQKKVILHQTEFYHTLWIQKYEEYSD